jgi:ABC-type transport system involved in multi-copper enzyme maturation permease subunit
VIAIARLTVIEISRRRFALVAAIGTIAIAALTFWAFHSLHAGTPGPRRPLGPVQARALAAVMLPVIVYLFNFVLAFAATMLAATTLSAEVESGVLLPVLARPVSRAAVVCGKALGLGTVLVVYAAISALLEFGAVFATTGFWPPHPFVAVASLAAVPLVMLAFTLALASRMQGIACGIVAIVGYGIAWAGGIASGLAMQFHNETLVHAGTVAQLLLPTDVFWRTAVFALQPVALTQRLAASGNWPGPFFVVLPPPASIIIWGCLWIVAMLAIAARSFSTRDV